MTSLVTAILRSEAELESVADEWRQLYARVSRGLFSDYDWFSIWWTNLAKPYASNKLHVVTGRRDGKLVAVAPLYVTRRKGLRVMQAGGHKAFYCCDMLAETDEDALGVWQAARRSPYYDFADIRDVYIESACHAALSSFAHKRDVIGAFSMAITWKKGEDFLPDLPMKARRDYNKNLRRMEQKGPIGFEICRESPVPVSIIDDMVRHKVSWAFAKEKDGLFHHPNVTEYFRQLLPKAAEQKRLVLTWLKCGEDIIAYYLWFAYKDTFRASVVSYDPAWIAVAPGNTIMTKSMMWAIDNGFAKIDMAQGGGYKARFSNDVRECAEFTFARSLRGKLLEWAFISARTLVRKCRGDVPKADEDVKAETKLKSGEEGEQG